MSWDMLTFDMPILLVSLLYFPVNEEEMKAFCLVLAPGCEGWADASGFKRLLGDSER